MKVATNLGDPQLPSRLVARLMGQMGSIPGKSTMFGAATTAVRRIGLPLCVPRTVAVAAVRTRSDAGAERLLLQCGHIGGGFL